MDCQDKYRPGGMNDKFLVGVQKEAQVAAPGWKVEHWRMSDGESHELLFVPKSGVIQRKCIHCGASYTK